MFKVTEISSEDLSLMESVSKKLAYDFFSKYRNMGNRSMCEFEDFQQEAMVACMRAYKNYDPNHASSASLSTVLFTAARGELMKYAVRVMPSFKINDLKDIPKEDITLVLEGGFSLDADMSENEDGESFADLVKGACSAEHSYIEGEDVLKEILAKIITNDRDFNIICDVVFHDETPGAIVEAYSISRVSFKNIKDKWFEILKIELPKHMNCGRC